MANNQFFSVKHGDLLYLGEQVPAPLLTEARRVLDDIRIPQPTPEYFYKSLIYTIANQRSKYEAPLRFMQLLRHATVSQLTDPAYLASVARASEIGLLHDDRFGPALEFCADYQGGIEQLVQDFLAEPQPVRQELVKNVRWLGSKTASFWYMSLGGSELMTLDVHNLRQIAGLGVDVRETHYLGKRRSDGRSIVTKPSASEYNRIEAETLELLSWCAALRNGKGPDASLITTLFWNAGAKTIAGRNQHPLQHSLFDEEIGFSSPY